MLKSTTVFFTAIITASTSFSGSLDAQQLSEVEWATVDESIERATNWIASTQQRDGSFPSIPYGQPAVTSFGVLAMLAQGELPEGERGQQLTRAIDYTINTQKPSGLLAVIGPGGVKISRNVGHRVGQTAVYNHAISSLMLTEAYATTSSEQSERMRKAIERALKLTLEMQAWNKPNPTDRGGWRYLDRYKPHEDSDLSVIGWQLMFLRSAKNAGFEIPKQSIDDAVTCVRKHFSQRHRRFMYAPNLQFGSRAMTGAGILAMAHAGLHDTPEAKQAASSLSRFSFTRYNASAGALGRYHYSLFQCTQAAFQLGDDFWQRYSPPVYRTLLANQDASGSWEPESQDEKFGKVYTTSLVVLSMSAPNQLLPIFQR